MIQIGKAWQFFEAVASLDILFDYTWQVMNLRNLTLRHFCKSPRLTQKMVPEIQMLLLFLHSCYND